MKRIVVALGALGLSVAVVVGALPQDAPATAPEANRADEYVLGYRDGFRQAVLESSGVSLTSVEAGEHGAYADGYTDGYTDAAVDIARAELSSS